MSQQDPKNVLIGVCKVPLKHCDKVSKIGYQHIIKIYESRIQKYPLAKMTETKEK
jgi:hypothetical protein